MKKLVGGSVLALLALACASVWALNLVAPSPFSYAWWFATPTPDILVTSTPTPTACPHFQVPTPVVYGNTLPDWRVVEEDMYRIAHYRTNCRNYYSEAALQTYLDGLSGKSVKNWQGWVKDLEKAGENFNATVVLDADWATPQAVPTAVPTFRGLVDIGADVLGLHHAQPTATPAGPKLLALDVQLSNVSVEANLMPFVGRQITFSGQVSTRSGEAWLSNYGFVLEHSSIATTGRSVHPPNSYIPYATDTPVPTPTEVPTETPIPVPTDTPKPTPTLPINLRRMVVTLHSEGCRDSCPNYLVTIRGDGTTRYEGFDHVKIAGVITGTIGGDQLHELAQAVADADYFSLDNSYYDITPTADQPIIITSVTFGAETKLVGHYLGDTRIPPGLSYLEELIKEDAEVDKWVLFDPGATETPP